MTHAEIKQWLLDKAKEVCAIGPGYTQEGVVLREAREHFNAKDLETEQEILDCWHELFLERRIAWGYDLDNPGFPFIRLPAQRSMVAS
jgi:hypothetical protein